MPEVWTAEAAAAQHDNLSKVTQKSYHDKIQEIARTIEVERAKKYANQGGAVLRRPTISWTELQLEFLYAAIYKLLRVKNDTCDKEKALDDILDAYNYCALLYADLTK